MLFRLTLFQPAYFRVALFFRRARRGEQAPGVPSVAIVGRPNVGKSTLFNRLIGDERSVVHDLPGTTRDSIDTLVSTPDGDVRFVDTAGMRRRAKEAEGAEYYSLVRALQALDRADAALLVIDAPEGLTRQDQRLAERVDAAGHPVVIILNKWELLDAAARAQVIEDLEDRLGFLAYAPVLKVSARTGLGVHRLYPALRTSLAAAQRRVATGELNRVLAAAQGAHRSPGGASCTPPRGVPTRRPSRSSPPGRSPRPTCGTWSGPSGSTSTSVRRRWSSGSGAGPRERVDRPGVDRPGGARG